MPTTSPPIWKRNPKFNFKVFLHFARVQKCLTYHKGISVSHDYDVWRPNEPRIRGIKGGICYWQIKEQEGWCIILIWYLNTRLMYNTCITRLVYVLSIGTCIQKPTSWSLELGGHSRPSEYKPKSPHELSMIINIISSVSIIMVKYYN